MKSEQAEIDDPKSNAKALIQKNQIKELRDTHGSQLERLSRNKVENNLNILI